MTTRTLYDVRRDKHTAELRAEHRNAVKAARAQVRHWERQFARFGGEVHATTLAKFKTQLANLLK